MTDQTNRQCGPECAEGHLYAYRCALKPPPVSPWKILGVGAEPEPAAPASSGEERRRPYRAAVEHLRDTGAIYSIDDPEADRIAAAMATVAAAETAALRAERDQYASAIRHLIDTVKWTAYDWSQTQPDTMRRDDVVNALNNFARQHTQRHDLRNDLWQRIVGAYYLRFENDGHPEDSQAAADEAMAIVQPELDRLEAVIDRVHQACATVPPCTPGTQAEDTAHAAGWNAAMDHVLNALTTPKKPRP